MSRNRNELTKPLVELEIWQGLIVMSMIFLLASGLMFFGALVPQNRYFTLLENNRTKTEVYAHYAQTQAYALDEEIVFDQPASPCFESRTYEWTGRANTRYQDVLDGRFSSLEEISGRGPEFKRFLAAVNTYNNALDAHLELERTTGRELSGLLNTFQTWCNRDLASILPAREEIDAQLSAWGRNEIIVSQTWQSNVNQFLQTLEQTSSSRGNSLAEVLKQDVILAERYANLFAIRLDFRRSVEKVQTAREEFLTALETYETAEFEFARTYDQQQAELLYFSPDFSANLDEIENSSEPPEVD